MTKKTKSHIARLLVSTMVVFVIYLAGAFGAASFDIKEWHGPSRGMIAFFMAFSWFMAFTAPFYDDFF